MPRICCMLFISVHVVINLHEKINTKLEIIGCLWRRDEQNRTLTTSIIYLMKHIWQNVT